MSLKQLTIMNAKPGEKPYKLFDGKGLHLLVKPNGSKLWRFRYQIGGKEKLLSLGAFPEVSISDARDKILAARKLVVQSLDPSAEKKAAKIKAAVAAGNTFGAIVIEYHAKLKAEGKSESTLEKNRWLLEDLASPLTNRPATQITSAEILQVLQRIEKSGRVDTAHRLRGTIGSVFRFAIATLRAENDPTQALRGALAQTQVTHRAAVTDERELGALMASINDYDGWPTLRAALQLVALTMTRPGDSLNEFGE